VSIDFTITNALILVPIAFVGIFISGVCGFGANVVTLPILTAFFDLKTAVLVLMFPSVVNPAILAWTLRRDIAWRVSIVLIAAGCAAILPGAILLARVPEGPMLAGLGVILFLLSLAGFFARDQHGPLLKTAWPHAAAAGVAGGLLAGAYGTPGPPIVLYVYNTPWPRNVAKAACALFFVVVMAIRIPAYAMENLLTPQLALWSLALCPLSFIGIRLGHALSLRMNARKFKLAVYLVLAAGGVNLLRKGIALILTPA